MYVKSAFLLPLLFAIASASEAAETSSTCIVHGGRGSYSYDPTSGEGPEDWGKHKDFKMCGEGMIQSPINFPMEVVYAPIAEGPKPNISKATMEMGSTVYNWALNCPEGKSCGKTAFLGKEFKVANAHFHSPSEHTLNGKQYPLEMHIVHATDDGAYGVIATMFDYPNEETYQYSIYNNAHSKFETNEMIDEVLSGLQGSEETFEVNLGSVINAKKGYCVYVGSLTTPPCTEGVTFMMSNHVETVTRRQVATYQLTTGAGFDGNNRPTQPMNGREVLCYVA